MQYCLNVMKLSSVNLLDLMNTVPVGIFSVDMDLNINFINATGLDILKISEEDVLGKNCQAIMRNDLCKEACPLQQTLDTGEAIINKTVCITPHNKRFPVSISTAAMRDKKGNIIGAVETFRDLSQVETTKNETDKI